MKGANTKKKLTKRIVEALKPNTLVWDTVVGGFGVRRQKDAKTYILKVHVHDGGQAIVGNVQGGRDDKKK